MTPPTLYLIDGSGFIFRAYHALPPLSRPDGTPVGAVLGFTNMLVRLLKDKAADHVAVVFDAARKNFRNDIYPDYKAHRPPPPEDLVPQFPLIRQAAQAFSLPTLEMEGFEADDLIATYARLARAEGHQVVIVSSDKDLLQLIAPGISMMDPIKQTLMGPEAAVEKFGVPPEKVPDVQALCGDATDNVPGVDGIGVKTAAALIGEYGDLETLLSRAGEIKQQKRRETLMAQVDRARLSYRLVRLDDCVPVTVPVQDLTLRDPSMPDLPAFLAAQGFQSVLHRMGLRADHAALSRPKENESAAAKSKGEQEKTSPPLHPVPPADVRYDLITTLTDLAAWMDAARAAGIMAVDTETTGLTPAAADLVGISICVDPGHAGYIPLGHQAGGDLFGDAAAPSVQQLPVADVMAAMKAVMEDKSILKIGHNFKFDYQFFAAHGVRPFPMHDTMLMSYVLYNSASSHGLSDLSQRLLGVTGISYDDVTGTGKNRITFDRVSIDKARDYAAEDADFTRRLYDVLAPALQAAHMQAVYEDIERPLIHVIADMEQVGIRVDPQLLSHLSHDFGTQMASLEAEIYALVGHPFNLSSPRQVGTVLFEEMGLPGGTRTKTGEWSTSAEILEELSEGGQIVPEKLLEWRALAKLKSTYTDALVSEINPRTGRVHTSYAMALTATGRLSSSDPNLQNIPIRTENGRKIRRAFVTDPGWKLISVDYSQIELRLIAEIAGIPALLQAFKEGVDIHAATASAVFGVPMDQVTPDLRRSAKTINFGIIYGISGFGLARQLGCDVPAANAYIRQYMERFPELAAYMEETKAQAARDGYVTTAFGRRIVIHGAQDKNAARRAFAARQAINAPIQGTDADLMKIAMAQVPDALRAAGMRARLLLQVHDELVLEAPADEAQKAADLVRQVLQAAAAPFHVPITASAGIADNWDDAH